jgi:hypothetical protein
MFIHGSSSLLVSTVSCMATGAASARNIHCGSGCGPSNLSSWPKKKTGVQCSLLYPKKPSLPELRAELLLRDPSARCNTLGLQALADRLLQLPPRLAESVSNNTNKRFHSFDWFSMFSSRRKSLVLLERWCRRSARDRNHTRLFE